LEEGRAAHERHGWQVAWARGMNRLALGLLAVGALLIVVGVLIR